MKHWIVGAALYTVAWFLVAFGIVLVADRRLGVPTPYSVMAAPLILPCVAAVLLLLRDRRVTHSAALHVADKIPQNAIIRRIATSRRASHRAEGFVLLQVPSSGTQRGEAAA